MAQQYTYDETQLDQPSDEELAQIGPPIPEGLAKPTDFGEPTNAFTNRPEVAAADPDYNFVDTSKLAEPYLEGRLGKDKQGNEFPEGFAFNPETGDVTVTTRGGGVNKLSAPREPDPNEMYKYYKQKGGNLSPEEFANWYASDKPPVDKEDAAMVSKYGMPPKGYPAHPFDREKFEKKLLEDKIFRGQNPFKRDPNAEMEQVFKDNMERKFNEVFQGNVTWADRGKLTKEQMAHWESEALRYRAAIFNAAKADADSQKEFWKYSMGEFDSMKKDYDTRMEKVKVPIYRTNPETGMIESINVPRSDVPAYLSKRGIDNKLEGWTEGKPTQPKNAPKEQTVDVFSPSANRTIKVPRSEADAIISGKKLVLGSEKINDWQMGKATKEEKVWVFDPADPDRSKRQVNRATADILIEKEDWKEGQPTAPRDEPGKLTENQVAHELNNYALENSQDYDKMYEAYRNYVSGIATGTKMSREDAYRETLKKFPKRRVGGAVAPGTTVPKASASKPAPSPETNKGISSLWKPSKK